MKMASGRGVDHRRHRRAEEAEDKGAGAHRGCEMRQSMLPRRWYRNVPRMPVKRKLKSDVAAA